MNDTKSRFRAASSATFGQGPAALVVARTEYNYQEYERDKGEQDDDETGTGARARKVQGTHSSLRRYCPSVK